MKRFIFWFVAVLIIFLVIHGVNSIIREARADVQSYNARVFCDTDTDCMIKFGGDGGPGVYE